MRNRQHRGRGCRNQQTEPRTWGILLIIAGVIFLLHQLPVTRQIFPHWLFTWPMILVVVGLFSGIRSGFKGAGWLIVSALGILFLIHQQSWFVFSLRPYFWPLALIVLGLIIYFKRSVGKDRHSVGRDDHYNRGKDQHTGEKDGYHRSPKPEDAGEDAAISLPATEESPVAGPEEWLDVNAIFGHVERRIHTRSFKGGQISATFGGAEINLCHSDIQGTVTLNISALFGGIEIVLPSNWQVKNEVSVIMGGLDDRRLPQAGAPTGDGKVLIIKGSVIFGGVELKNY